MHVRRSWAVPVLVIVLAYLATILLLPREGFWINDNGCKFIQMEGMIRTHYTDFSIPWLGHSIDPMYDFRPLGDPFGHVVEGKLYASFSITFALISSLPYRLFGNWGLYLLPMLGGLLTLPAVWRLSGMLAGSRIGRPLALIVVALGTPVWFYSATFWEHTPALCLAIWGIVFTLRFWIEGGKRWLLLGAILCGLAIYLRDDLYLLGGTLAALLIVRRGMTWRAPALFVAGLLLSVIPIWCFQWLVLGDPLGFHVTAHSPLEGGVLRYLADRWTVLRDLLLDSHATPVLSFAVGAPYVLLLLTRPKLPASGFRRAVPILAWLAAAGGLIVLAGHLTSDSPIRWLQSANGLFAVSPILILALVSEARSIESGSDPRATIREEEVRRLLQHVIVLFALAYVALAPAVHVGGIHWGSRLLLPIYPLLAVLAASTVGYWWDASRPRRAGAVAPIALCLALSFATQGYSIHLLHERKSFSAELNDAVAKRPESTVVAIGWFLPQELARSFYTKTIFLPRSSRGFEDLLDRLGRAGLTDVLLLRARPGRNPASPGGASFPEGDSAPPGVQLFEDDLSFISVEMSRVRLRSDRGPRSVEP